MDIAESKYCRKVEGCGDRYIDELYNIFLIHKVWLFATVIIMVITVAIGVEYAIVHANTFMKAMEVMVIDLIILLFLLGVFTKAFVGYIYTRNRYIEANTIKKYGVILERDIIVSHVKNDVNLNKLYADLREPLISWALISRKRREKYISLESNFKIVTTYTGFIPKVLKQDSVILKHNRVYRVTYYKGTNIIDSIMEQADKKE